MYILLLRLTYNDDHESELSQETSLSLILCATSVYVSSWDNVRKMMEIESLDRVGGWVVKKNSVHVRLAKRKTVYISKEKQYTTFIITGTSQNLNPKIKCLLIA